MKTSKKILLITTGLVIVLMIAILVVFQNNLQTLQGELASQYNSVSIGKFEKLDFSSHWMVNIRQGNEYKVELAADDDAILKPRVENIEGTLFCTVDSSQALANRRIMRVKITAPSLQGIKALQGTKIHLENFESDSLSLILEGSAAFTGSNNHFKFISFKTSGEVSLQLTEDADIIK
jgi:hypothetical protein